MLSGDQLNQSDLSHSSFKTSIESLCESNRNEGIRGPTSFGTIICIRYCLSIISES